MMHGSVEGRINTPHLETSPSFFIGIVFLLLAFEGCSPFYVLRAAYEHSKILAAREPIEDVIKDPATSALEREKLQLVLDARAFAKEIGLEPGNSFMKYSRVNRDVLAWVVLGSKPDSFKLHTWWFPIVGSVPYKGYFEKTDAEHAAKVLELKGYETWVRGTEAFSTLGWFNDPLLSTTLDNDDTRIVNTILHESVHSTIWIKNQVEFNESFASFIGAAGAVKFFEHALKMCLPDDKKCAARENERLVKSKITQQREAEVGGVIEKLYRELQELYSMKIPYEEKIAKRVEIFERVMQPVRTRYPSMTILKTINNAEIMQLKLYMTGLSGIEEVYHSCNSSIPCLMERAKRMEEKREKGNDPFAALKQPA